jgi:hypothetical protein
VTTYLGRRGKLCVIGCASSLLYVALAAIFWTDALFLQSRTVATAIFITVALLTVLYFAGIPLMAQASLRTIVAFSVVFALVGFLGGPFDSTDVFFYIAQGWAQSHYNNNPYTDVLRDIPNALNDPMIANRWMTLNRNPWLDEPMPYGFAFALLARGVASVGGGDWWWTLAVFNLLNLVIHAGTAFLLWKLAVLIPGTDPRLALYLYAWSPLIVLQYLLNVHNDIIMAALILLAFYLVTEKRYVWVLPVLVAAGFFKYVAFALVPFVFGFFVRKRAWKDALNAGALSLTLTVVVSLPYVLELPAFRTRQVFEQFGESSGSLHAFVVFTGRALARFVSADGFEVASLSHAANIALWSIVALFTICEYRKAWLTQTYASADMATRWTSILFSIVFVGSSQFYPWYIGMFLPLSLVRAGQSRLTDVVITLSATHMVFAFMRSKAIGYFLLSSGLPLVLLFWYWQKSDMARPIVAFE